MWTSSWDFTCPSVEVWLCRDCPPVRPGAVWMPALTTAAWGRYLSSGGPSSCPPPRGACCERSSQPRVGSELSFSTSSFKESFLSPHHVDVLLCLHGDVSSSLLSTCNPSVPLALAWSSVRPGCHLAGARPVPADSQHRVSSPQVDFTWVWAGGPPACLNGASVTLGPLSLCSAAAGPVPRPPAVLGRLPSLFQVFCSPVHIWNHLSQNTF